MRRLQLQYLGLYNIQLESKIQGQYFPSSWITLFQLTQVLSTQFGSYDMFTTHMIRSQWGEMSTPINHYWINYFEGVFFSNKRFCKGYLNVLERLPLNITQPNVYRPDHRLPYYYGLPKKIAVLLDFVQMRGGPAQIFCPLFTHCILGQFGDGEGGGDPCPNFWHIGVQKKWYKLSKLGGGGVKVIWTKSKRTATFFRETVPKM